MRNDCISIRQPWAHLILRYGKNIENRSWRTWLRGRVYVHAAARMDANEYSAALAFAEKAVGGALEDFPHAGSLKKGGIVGSVEIVDCVREHGSPWFSGPWGFVLRNPEELPFRPCRGRLGFFRAEGS